MSVGSNPMASSILLEVKNLSKTYPLEYNLLGKVTKRLQALQDISFEVEAGQTLGLIGESGSGKSTIARIIAKLIPADGGSILLQNQDILKMNAQNFAPYRQRIQMIFQDPNSSLNPRLTIKQILEEPLIGFKMGNTDQRQQMIRDMLSEVGLDDSILTRYPKQLSGGQKQRVSILGNLLVKPQLIIADEIVSALDLSVQAQILNLWRELQQKYNLATIFISHDLQVIGWLADTVVVLYRGLIVERGSATAICNEPYHPYTQQLFAAYDENVTAIKAEPVNEANYCCPFYPRCPKRLNICQEAATPIQKLADDHYVWCHLAE